MVAHGYDGPSAAEIRNAVNAGVWTSLYLQSPDGQYPPNGRTDDHVFNDVLYGLIFDTMAQQCQRFGELRLAGRYRRAALLGYQEYPEMAAT